MKGSSYEIFKDGWPVILGDVNSSYLSLMIVNVSPQLGVTY